MFTLRLMTLSLMIAMVAAATPAQSNAPVSSTAAVSDLSPADIADPAARKAVEELLPRLDALAATEYSYTMTTEKPAAPGEPRSVIRDECAFRPPHFIFQKSTETRDLNGKQLIRTAYFVFDGSILWMHASGQLGPGATLADIFPGMPEPLQRSAAQRQLDPHVVRIDMRRVQRETGIAPGDYLARLFVMPHRPFIGLDLKSLALEDSPAGGPVILSARRIGASGDIRLEFSRDRGRLQSMRQSIPGDGGEQTLQFSGYEAAPKLPANHFSFHPPRGVSIRDATFSLIESAPGLAADESASAAGDALATNIMRSRTRLLSLATAIEAWFIANGQYPNQLSQLTTPVPYLRTIPDDPFRAGQPMNYKKLPDNDWAAWSVGPDGVDDGGEKELDVENIAPGDKGDIVRRKE